IESSVSAAKLLNPSKGWTDKFIFPPYDFSISNCFLTNLNPPKSTVVMMAAAFMGYEFMLHAYQEAVKEKYRFYCYGDAMLIL
ncbi:MAG: S-adenosylmethionine:tRNA ribosyltransferase-isomerase, partial [Sphingobacteriia bacterium]